VRIKILRLGGGPEGYIDKEGTIWVFEDKRWYEQVEIVLHEIGHWIIMKLAGYESRLHELYEYVYGFLVYRKPRCLKYAVEFLRGRL